MKKILLLIVITSLVLMGCSDSDESGQSTNTDPQQMQTATRDDLCEDTPALSDEDNNEVLVTTNHGEFIIELDVQDAPKSSAHFAALVDKGFYDGLTFHRIISGFMIQGGDPNGDGTGSYECYALSEAPKDGYQIGDIAWAKLGTDPAGSAGSQFFIITGQSGANLPPEYGYVGKVVKGIDVVTQIENSTTDSFDKPIDAVVIETAKINS